MCIVQNYTGFSIAVTTCMLQFFLNDFQKTAKTMFNKTALFTKVGFPNWVPPTNPVTAINSLSAASCPKNPTHSQTRLQRKHVTIALTIGWIGIGMNFLGWFPAPTHLPQIWLVTAIESYLFRPVCWPKYLWGHFYRIQHVNNFPPDH